MNCIQRVENREEIKSEPPSQRVISASSHRASKIFKQRFSQLSLDFENNKKSLQAILESREVVNVASLVGACDQLEHYSDMLNMKVALFSEDRSLAHKSFIIYKNLHSRSQDSWTVDQRKFIISLSFYDAMTLFHSRGKIKSEINNRLPEDLTKIKKILRSRESRDFAVEKSPKWPPPKVLFGAYLVAVQIFENIEGCFITDKMDVHKLLWASQRIYNSRFSIPENKIGYIQVQAVAASIYFLCKYNLLNINELYELDRKLYDLYLSDVSSTQLKSAVNEFKDLMRQKGLVNLFKSLLSEWTLAKTFYFKYSKECGPKPLPILTPDTALFIKSNSFLALICIFFKNRKEGDEEDYAYFKKFLPKFLEIYVKFSCLDTFLTFRRNQARGKESERLKDISIEELDKMSKEQLVCVHPERIETNYFKDVLSNIKMIAQEVELDEDTIRAIEKLDSLANSIEISATAKPVEVDRNTLGTQDADTPSASSIKVSNLTLDQSSSVEEVSNSKKIGLIISVFDFKMAMLLLDEKLLKRSMMIKGEILEKLARNVRLSEIETKFLNSFFTYEIMVCLFYPSHITSHSIYVESKLQITKMLKSDNNSFLEITNKCLLGAFLIYVKTQNEDIAKAFQKDNFKLTKFLGLCKQIYENRLNIEPSEQSYFNMMALSATIYFLCKYKELDYEALPFFEQKLSDFMVIRNLRPELLRGFFRQYQGHFKTSNDDQNQKKVYKS